MKRSKFHPRPVRGQRGVTLVVALMLLTALGLMAAWAIKSSMNDLRVVGNTQARQEAFAAAQTAIEATISQPTFSQQPAAVAANPIPVDLDGDGTADLTATLSPAPSCYRWRSVKTVDLDPAVAADRACLSSGAAGNAGIESASGTTSGNSLCADSEWNVRAVVTSANSGVAMNLNQGVSVRGLVTDVSNNCP